MLPVSRMRKNGYSTAFRDFEQNLSRSRTLRALERGFLDPPKPEEQAAVEALRGACVVLAVATFEAYLKDVMSEHVDAIGIAARSTRHPNLSADFVRQNDLAGLTALIRDSRLDKQQKLAELRRLATLITQSGFIPESFSQTRANPGPSVVKDLCNAFGVKDPFNKIQAAYVTHAKQQIAMGFVEQTLRSVIDRRNEVAHEGVALSISREDISAWLTFMHLLAKAIDNVLRDHRRSVIAALR